MLDLIKLTFGLLTAVAICYYLVSIFAARSFFAAWPLPPPCDFPPVSVLVPLCGADFRAYENYASLCHQDYPEFQIVFGVRDSSDCSLALVGKIQADFPDVPIDLVISSEVVGPNPKVNNLNNMLPTARHEILILMDSDIRVGNQFLRKLVSELQYQGGGVVTCLYRAGDAPGVAAKLEAVGITAEFAPGVLVARIAGGISFAFGAAIVMNREALDIIGGFPAVAAYLADDYMIGNLVRKAGYPVNLSRYVVETVLSRLTFKDFIRHQVRWARGIRACSPWGHTGSILANGTVLAMVFLLLSGFSSAGWLLFLATIGIRFASARLIGIKLLGDKILERNFLLIPLRDIISLFIWSSALFGKRVTWRGQSYRIVHDGKMLPEKG